MENRMEFIRAQQIERRMSVRVPVRLPVIVEFPPRIENNCLPGVTCNISFDGASIKNIGPALQEGALARLSLGTAPKDPRAIDALVLRSNVQGIVVMFADYGEEVFDHLATLLKTEFDKYFGVRSWPSSIIKETPLLAESINLESRPMARPVRIHR